MSTLELFEPRADLGPIFVRGLCPQTGVELASTTIDVHETRSFGSGAAASVRLAASSVSETHAELRHCGGSLRVVDLRSRNGTFLGGYRVQEGELFPGARLQLGDVSLELSPAATQAPATAPPLPGVIGRSPLMLRLSARVRRLAPLAVPVLVRGESGTGKELVARALHTLSGRKGPFIAINAATLSRELGESELFGHRRGAFTGAVSDRTGAFREADGGTLFIDELGSLAIEVQAKLLRAVEDGLVRPVGQDLPIPIDVRLLTATCEDIERDVARGTFRRDLYERIAVSVVRVPPLRERPEDLPLLTRHLLGVEGFVDLRATSCALSALRREALRGNVRELRSLLVLSAVAASEENAPLLRGHHVMGAISERRGRRSSLTADEAERTMSLVDGNLSAAARALHVPRSTLRDLLRRGRH